METIQYLGWATAAIVILIELILIFNLITNKSSKLQYFIKDISAQESISKTPYSYSRSQLIWWTMIVITCFSIQFAITGEIDGVMNNTALILIGISAGTTLAGRVIDNSQQTNVATTATHQDEPSEGFWMDILSDQNGVSIHRFQAVIFNLVFGFAFIVQFINSVAGAKLGTAIPLPEFGETALGLIGLSSGTYTALKFNENLSKSTTSTTNQNTNTTTQKEVQS